MNVTYLERFAVAAMPFPAQSLMISAAVVRHVTPTTPLIGGSRADGTRFSYHSGLKWYTTERYVAREKKRKEKEGENG
jgi:hypothetical protein